MELSFDKLQRARELQLIIVWSYEEKSEPELLRDFSEPIKGTERINIVRANIPSLGFSRRTQLHTQFSEAEECIRAARCRENGNGATYRVYASSVGITVDPSRFFEREGRGYYSHQHNGAEYAVPLFFCE